MMNVVNRVQCSDGENVYTVKMTEDEFNGLEALGEDATEALREMALMKSVCTVYNEDFADIVHRMHSMMVGDHGRLIYLVKWFMDMREAGLVTWPQGGDEPCVTTSPQKYSYVVTSKEKWPGEGKGKDETDDKDDVVKAYLKYTLNSVYGASPTKLVHPDEDCVLPGCDRYGGNDTYLRIRKVLGHKGAFDFCMGNVVKLVDRWDKKGDPVQNLEKLRDYSAQALIEWRLWSEKLS